MKKITIILTALLFVVLLIISCRKAKEPESKKEIQVQQAHEEVKQASEQQPTEVKPSETKPEAQPRQEQPLAEIKSSPVTEAERKKVEAKFHGEILREAFKTDKEVIEYLTILLKGNHKTFHLKTPDKPGATEGEPLRRFQYGDVIRILLSYLKIKDSFPFAIEILKTKKDYPEAMSTAAKILKFAQDKSVIPLLREVAKHPDPTVRFEAAGSLLSLGDADTALPILDELTEKEGYSSTLYYLFSKLGKIIDERGYAIVEKALKHPKAEVRIHAVKLLLDSKKITRDKAEEMAIRILEELKDRRRSSYGIGGRKPQKQSYPAETEWFALPGYEGKTIEELEKPYHSDSRACEYTVSILSELKSKKAIPALKYIKKNNIEKTEYGALYIGYVCSEDEVTTALENILEGWRDK